MERPHGQLGSRLTNRLGGDDTNGFTDLSQFTRSQVQTVTLLAATAISLACESGADSKSLEAELLDLISFLLTDKLTNLEDDLACDGIFDPFTGNATVDTGS